MSHYFLKRLLVSALLLFAAQIHTAVYSQTCQLDTPLKRLAIKAQFLTR